MRRSWTQILLPALAVALVLGPSLRPGRLIGDEGLDVWAHAWGLGWWAQSLGKGEFPWRPAGIAWPDGGVLWNIDPLGALLTLPASWIGGPALGWNTEVVLQITLAALGGSAYGRALGGRGWIAGIALATCPFLLCELHDGVAEAAWLGLVPLAGAAAVRGSPWTGLWVGLAWAATPYHGVSATLIAATHLLSVPTPAAARARSALRALLLAALVAAPFLIALKLALAAPDALTRKPPPGDNWPVFRINAVDPVALVHPGRWWTVSLDGPLEAPFRRTPYLGLGLLALSGWSLIRDRRRLPLLLPALVCVILCLGPYLWRDGDWVRTADGRLVALPFRALLALGGVSMDHPLRFVGGALAILAGLADAAVPARSRRSWLALALALGVAAEHLLLGPAPWPLHTAPADLPAVYADLPADGRAVVDLPADHGDSMATNRYLYWHGIHHRSIPYAVKVGSQGFPSLNAALRTWTALGRLQALPVDAPGAVAPGTDLRPAVAELVAQGYGWVVLHPELLARPELLETHVQALDPLLGPHQEIDGALVWSLSAGQDHNRR